MCYILIGRLGKDAEVSQTSGGTNFVRFTVAENKYRNGEDKTTWFDVISYDPFVINTQIKVLKKGTFVVVVGQLDSRINIGKNGNVYQNFNITSWNINVPNLGTGKNDTPTAITTDSTPVTESVASPSKANPSISL